MHVKGVCLAWWLVILTNEIVHLHELICFGPCNNFSLLLFPCIQFGYVNSLHRPRIGGGEIQGAKEKKAKTRRTNEENEEM